MSEEDRSRQKEAVKAKYDDLSGRARPVLDRINEKGARLHDRIIGVLQKRKSGEEGEERKSGEEGEE